MATNRKLLIEAAIKLGRDEKAAKKSNTKSLERYIARHSNSQKETPSKPQAISRSTQPRKRNTNFRIGLDRKQLIEAAMIYGRDEKSAKKANTKTLENFVIKQITGKKTKVPELSPTERREINDNANAWGIKDALRQLTYKAEKLSGLRNEENFLRLTIQDGFSLYYDGLVKPHHVDELISRLPQLEGTQVDSEMINISPYYRNLFIDYAEELEEQQETNNSKRVD